jgi:hypothetical protein
MTEMIVVPGPEPDWDTAFSLQGRAGNPVRQGFAWDAARSVNREVAVLAAPFAAITARFRLATEAVAEELGEVDAATFLMRDVWYTISRFKGDDSNGVVVAVAADTLIDDDEAVDRLVAALGASPDIVGYRLDEEISFIEDDPTPLHRFAGRVRLALVAAGLPIVPNRYSARRLAGARLELHPEDGPTGSVAVSWQAHPKLHADPPTSACHLAQLAMADAMATILTASGFTTVARAGRLLLRQAVEEGGRYGDPLRIVTVPGQQGGPARDGDRG